MVTGADGGSKGFGFVVFKRKADAEQEVVVLRALQDDAVLASYYERIGFTSRQQDFEENGLGDSYRDGDMLYT